MRSLPAVQWITERGAVFQQMRKQLAETVRVEPDIAAIGLAHDLERIAGRQRARLKPRPQCRHDRRFDRQRMHVDLLNDAGRGCALVGPAKIEGVLDAEIAHHLDVVLGEVAEMVGAENLPPAHRAAVAGRIAAKVAEIAGALRD